MTNENTSASLDSLLAGSIDDLADLPEFAKLPAGAHKVSIKWEKKEVNKHPSLELKMKLIEHIELSNATDTPLEAGAESSVLFMLDNEFGQGKMKEVMKVLATACGTSTISETMEASNGMEVTVITNLKPNKDKTENFMNVVKVVV
jgi:hypothetical protein